MSQMEQQLKRVNPEAFKNYQQAKKDNINPNEYLNQVTNGFSPEQKKQWEQMMNNFGINAK